jgi:hypothetical protein
MMLASEETYVASFEIRRLNHGAAIGSGLYDLGYDLIKMYLQVIHDCKEEHFEKLIVGVCVKNKII